MYSHRFRKLIMASPKKWQLTYSVQNHHVDEVSKNAMNKKMLVILYLKGNPIEIVKMLENKAKLNETRKFSQKCHSQVLTSELFPDKNDSRKFTEQCKMNFFFPDTDNLKVEGIAKQRRQEKQKERLNKSKSLI